MGPHNCAVDQGILVVCFSSQHFKDPLPDTQITPAHVTSVIHPQVTKAFGQVSPRFIDTITLEHRLDKEAIIFGSHSDGSQSDKEQVFDALPLIITKSIWSGGHGSSLQREK